MLPSATSWSSSSRRITSKWIQPASGIDLCRKRCDALLLLYSRCPCVFVCHVSSSFVSFVMSGCIVFKLTASDVASICAFLVMGFYITSIACDVFVKRLWPSSCLLAFVGASSFFFRFLDCGKADTSGERQFNGPPI